MKAHEFLVSKDQWCQGNLSVNKDGVPTMPESKNTCKWCLVGLIQKCYPSPISRTKIYKQLIVALGGKLHKDRFDIGPLPSWNDNKERKFLEVKELLKKENV